VERNNCAEEQSKPTCNKRIWRNAREGTGMANWEIGTYDHGVAHTWKVTVSPATMVSHTQGKLHNYIVTRRIDVEV
jgi:hypothetical protein